MATVALVAGIALLVQQPIAPSAPSVARPSADGTGPRPTSPRASAPQPAVPTEVGRSDSSPSPAVAVDAPVAVQVPTVGLSLGVVPVGVRDDGQMAVPTLVSELGWYRHGPAPGDAEGSAVLAAHVASELGSAPMASVLRAAVGDPVRVTTLAGAELRYRIISIEQLSKHGLPLDVLFAREGEHVLRLVTCGGAWDPVTRSYDDNIVVTAALGTG